MELYEASQSLRTAQRGCSDCCVAAGFHQLYCPLSSADRWPTVCQWQLARRPPTRRYTSSTRWQYSCWHFDYRCCFNRRSIARRCDACCNGSRRAGEIPAKNPSQSKSDNQKHRPLMQYRCHIALQWAPPPVVASLGISSETKSLSCTVYVRHALAGCLLSAILVLSCNIWAIFAWNSGVYFCSVTIFGRVVRA